MRVARPCPVGVSSSRGLLQNLGDVGPAAAVGVIAVWGGSAGVLRRGTAAGPGRCRSSEDASQGGRAGHQRSRGAAAAKDSQARASQARQVLCRASHGGPLPQPRLCRLHVSQETGRFLPCRPRAHMRRAATSKSGASGGGGGMPRCGRGLGRSTPGAVAGGAPPNNGGGMPGCARGTEMGAGAGTPDSGGGDASAAPAGRGVAPGAAPAAAVGAGLGGRGVAPARVPRPVGQRAGARTCRA